MILTSLVGPFLSSLFSLMRSMFLTR